jgi:uncharacterized protein (TIGR03118 family)
MKRASLFVAIGGLAASMVVSSASAAPIEQINLVSSVPGLAQLTDPNLINPWGLSFSAASPFWVSNQGTSSTQLFHITNGQAIQNAATGGATTIAIPTTATGPQGPTGQVFNAAGATAFVLGGTTSAANFIFANLNGTISAWSGAVSGASASIQATTPGAIYTGLAIAGTGANAKLFAANSAGTGSIDVFNSSFVKQAAGGFVDTDARLAGLVPFNVQTIGSSVYVTYAPAGGRPNQIGATDGQGAVAVFDTSGNLIQTLIAGAGDHLASPWGVALAPSNFGQFSNDLLVGNFSFADSEINVFDPTSGAFISSIDLDLPFATNGIWALEFGNGVTAPSNGLLFAVGLNGEAAGLIGILLIPEPESIALFGLGLVALFAGARRRRTA